MVLAFLQIKIIRHINFRLNLKSCKFELTQDHKDMDRGFVSVGAVGAFAPTVSEENTINAQHLKPQC